jgi:5-methylcytosine-specific restriction endonuclease McrA
MKRTPLRRRVPLRTRSALRRRVPLSRHRGLIELRCDYCGVKFRRFVRRRRRGKKAFCCGRCACRFREREQLSNPREPVPQHSTSWWRHLRAYVRARDGFRCVLCGASERELGRKLAVDHVYPRRAFKRAIDIYLRFGAKVFVSLCPVCHGRKTGRAERDWLKGDVLGFQRYVESVTSANRG